MSGTDISSVIGGLYEASSGGGDWFSAGRELFRLLGVDGGSLLVRQAEGHLSNALQPFQPLEEQYGRRFAAIDPIRQAAVRAIPTREWGAAVRIGDELVDTKTFFQSEFFQDFARPLGRNQLLLGTLGNAERTLVLLFREKVPFNDTDKQNLAFMLPHLQRAVQLHERLRGAELHARIGHSAFEALPGSALVVDHDLNVLFANTTAERMLSLASCPLVLRRHATPAAGSPLRLVIRDRHGSERLQSLVADAASGGSGGAMRLEIDSGADDRLDQLAILVTPQLPQTTPAESFLAARAPVLILIKELSRPSAPRASLLSDLFGLSIAESAVALALLGGQTAESVARERDVSLETVRSQIRTVLRKSEAANLRDFERIGALLATLGR